MTLIVVPFAFWGTLSVQTESASVHQWLPKSRVQRQQYDRFVEVFGEDQFLLVSWDGLTLADPRCKSFIENLRAYNDKQKDRPFVDIESAADFVDRLEAPPLSLSASQATERLKGVLLGQDGTATILLRLSDAAMQTGQQTIDSVYKAVVGVEGLSASNLVLVGTLQEEVAVDTASENTLRYLVPPSMLAALLMARICLGGTRPMLLVFLLAGLGQVCSIATIYYTGGKFSSVLIVLPTLIFMLALSSAIHLVNYCREANARRADAKQAAAVAWFIGARPCMFASVTTIIGMGSLIISDLKPVRDFGSYAALLLAISTALLLALFPVLAAWILKSAISSEEADQDDSQASVAKPSSLDLETPSPIVIRIASLIRRWSVPISLASIALLIFCGVGVLQLNASTKFYEMFASNAPIIRSMHWVEDRIGPITSLEVVLDFPIDDKQSDLRQVFWLQRIDRSVKSQPFVGSTLSASTFLPPVPTQTGFRGTAKRAVFNRALDDTIPQLQKAGWVASDNKHRFWKITAKVSSLNQDYGEMVARLQSAINETLLRDPAADQPAIVITGLAPLIHQAQLVLLTDLGKSFLMALVLITPVMMLVTRSVMIGLLSMIPNVLPVVLVFGSMGWLGFGMDIAAILTASIALGIAVDDTLHFVSWYGKALQQSGDSFKAICIATQQCAKPMCQTTLISCTAMIPFLFAAFLPTQRFAILMIAMLLGAIIGDLILLPALLVSRFGRWASRRG